MWLGLRSPGLDARVSRVALLAAAVVLAAVPTVFAQTAASTGGIQGTITDPSGATISGAEVTITNKDRGQVTKTTSDASGAYASDALTPGNYVVRVEAKGFKTTDLPLTVQAGVTSAGSIRMELQTIELQINTEQAVVKGVLNTRQVENLPVNGRNFLHLAQLEPGVQIQDGTNFDPSKVGYSSVSFGGRFGRTARIEVDGTDVSDETVGTTTQNIPASAIAEFSLAQSTLDPSTELTSSGVVNVVTRSGSDGYHGQGFYLFRDDAAAAGLPHPAELSTPFQRHQLGGRFGGPLIKDKLFFFLDGEHTLQHLAAPVLPPAPFDAFSSTFPAPFKEGEALGRLDYQLTKSARLFYRYSYFQNSTSATFFPSSFQVYNSKNYTRQNEVGLDFGTGTFTHAVRFSYLKFQNRIGDAVRGSSLPLAGFPVSINIGPLSTGPNPLAPQSTLQSNYQVKYDGSKAIGKHLLRFGATFNHIQGGSFAQLFSAGPSLYSAPDPRFLGCTTPDPVACPAGPDGTTASNPLNYLIAAAVVGNGQGFSTERPAFGFPAGGLGPDNRVGLYIGDTWKISPTLTLTPGIRWVRDTGRTDSDLAGIPEINAVFPGYGNPVRQANTNFAPQLGLAWDPGKKGKTVFRAGMGLFYENVVYNNTLFDRSQRLRNGSFLAFPTVCASGSELPVLVPGGTIQLPAGTCAETVGQAAQAIADFQTQYQAATTFDLTAANPNFVGARLGAGLDLPLGLLAPGYRSPRSVQMNVGIQREIRQGTVFTADYVRNVTTHTLLGVDINHVGDARYFNMDGALAAITAATGPSGCGPATDAATAQAAVSCYLAAHPGANFDAFANAGLTSSVDLGGPGNCPTQGCAFGGINPHAPAAPFLFPVGRSVYNGLQMKLVQNLNNPARGLKAVNVQISYSLSRFVNTGGWQGNSAPSNPAALNDQDFVTNAPDNHAPLRYMGPSLLDRTHQVSIGGTFDLPGSFRVGTIAHFYSPLSSPAIVGATGSPGDIFRTDFTGDGTISDPLPGTKNGAFGRDFGVNGLNSVINTYDQNIAGQATLAGQVLISNGLFTLGQLATLGAVTPTITPPAPDQVNFKWLRTLDLKLSWAHTFREKLTVEPSVALFNVFNFANFGLPPATLSGWLNEGAGSINSTNKASDFRVGQGTGVFGLGSPRVLEFGVRITF